jgi:hypothetical protein
VAGVLPKRTCVAPLRLAPVTVTVVVPPIVPEDGLTPVTAGVLGPDEAVNRSDEEVAEVPLAVTTVIRNRPSDRLLSAPMRSLVWFSSVRALSPPATDLSDLY